MQASSWILLGISAIWKKSAITNGQSEGLAIQPRVVEDAEAGSSTEGRERRGGPHLHAADYAA